MPVGPPLPKGQKCAATATIASPTAQEPKAVLPEPKGGDQWRGAALHPVLYLKRTYLLRWSPLGSMWVTLNVFIVVMWRGVQRGPQLSEQLYIRMSTEPIWALNCRVLLVLRLFSILTPTTTMASWRIPLGLQTLFKLCYTCLLYSFLSCVSSISLLSCYIATIVYYITIKSRK